MARISGYWCTITDALNLFKFFQLPAEAWNVSVGDAVSAFTTNLHLQILETGATSCMNAALDDTHGLIQSFRPAGSAGYSYVMAMTVS